ncbi:hypothetical protein GPA22_04560 [Aromatoleum toluvorans]|uniref:DUF5710 domain-containing protein n=2 Tax=Aromatoleum toluvorans TaxID=92002 RepID=A0ABX1PWV7_9RHOO|nr:DUF5710 domain-containing protein [Aromatoleum toluvorans]NMG43001.1 hypothetical protein [Aromatoleum toluvorans]
MRMNLKVPFAEKDEAKKLGARWDAARKLWYIEGHLDEGIFLRWSPTPHDAAAPAASAPKRSSARSKAASDTVQVGSRYVERPRVCNCLPWDDCEKCRVVPTSTSLKGSSEWKR